jgi:MSHA biogenesis protein MshN
MSVINQMLKDLDQRQSGHTDEQNIVAPMASKNSTRKLMAVMSVALLAIMVALIFAWQLYSENRHFKAQLQQAAIANSPEELIRKSPTDNATINKSAFNESQNNAPLAEFVSSTTTEQTSHQPAIKNNASFPEDISDTAPIISKDNGNSSVAQSTHINHAASEQTQTTTSQASNMTVKAEKLEQTTAESEQAQVTAPSLTISRTQLSPQALAENKITQAEQAMERNDLAKAESLFEEVLLVVPEHETARKQLAALWYGKKYYQDAVNLLSQGIALAPQAQEMRLMSARIYYEQGQARDAFNILSPVQYSNSTEIQALLASTAAELNEHVNAINAYRKLITLEPDIGRWWLGLAVSLDSTAKFELASDAYKQAIASNNLSTAAMQFARQRLIELGE